MASDKSIIGVRVLYERETIGWVLHQTSSSATFTATLQEILDGKNPCIEQFKGLNLKVTDLDVGCTLKDRDQDVWSTTPLFYPLDEVSPGQIPLVKFEVCAKKAEIHEATVVTEDQPGVSGENQDGE